MPKINWLKAQREYVTDPTLSYAKIAAKYGVSETAVKEWASKLNWQKLRSDTLQNVADRLPEKAGEQIAEFQAEKLKIGKWMVGVGVKGIQEKPPRNSREAREIVDSGYKIASEALGLDKPGTQVNIQNNNFMSLSDFVGEMTKRKASREQEKTASTDTQLPVEQ